ncbi:MAG TPA: ABC transporter permease [Vicinamibacteria bacterium]|nr:ABC transporter permease [Vicinamibacteria bacterium]
MSETPQRLPTDTGLDGREATRLDAFLALCGARLREFYRESEVVFWGFAFPIILSVGLGIAFRNRPAETLPVAVVSGPRAPRAAEVLGKAPLLKAQVMEEAEATRALALGRVALVVAPRPEGGVEYRLDPSRAESAIARARADDALQRAEGRRDPVASSVVEVTEPGGRYIDFLIPGIVGMNIMSGGLWGVGFNLVDMRIKKLLKRLVASPMRRPDFLAAHLAMRLVFMVIEVTFVLGFGHLAFGVPVRGGLASLFAVGAMGALCFGGIGLLVGSRARRMETVTGLMNVVMVPMFVLSGIFFSADRFPQVLQPLIRILPLTALNDALRAVVLEGARLSALPGPLAVLAIWTVLTFGVGLKLFRWS